MGSRHEGLTHVSAFLEWQREDGLVVSTDPARLDLDRIQRWLADESYWAQDRAQDVIARSIEHSLCFGAYDPSDGHVGFCRMVTDRATFAWLCDVFVDTSARGRKIGEWMVACAVNHPDVEGLKRQMLATRDAHGLYERFGYKTLDPGDAARWMIRPGKGR